MTAKRLCGQLDDLDPESWQAFHKTLKRKTARISSIGLIGPLNTGGPHTVLGGARTVLRGARTGMGGPLTASHFKSCYIEYKNRYKNKVLTRSTRECKSLNA